MESQHQQEVEANLIQLIEDDPVFRVEMNALVQADELN
jgi:hypothetical protein